MFYNATTSEMTYGPPTANIPAGQVVYQGTAGLTGSSNLTIDTSGFILAGSYRDYTQPYAVYSNSFSSNTGDNDIDLNSPSINSIAGKFTNLASDGFFFDNAGGAIMPLNYVYGQVLVQFDSLGDINSIIQFTIIPGWYNDYAGHLGRIGFYIFCSDNLSYYRIIYNNNISGTVGLSTGSVTFFDIDGTTVLATQPINNMAQVTTLTIIRTEHTLTVYDNYLEPTSANNLFGNRVQLFGYNGANANYGVFSRILKMTYNINLLLATNTQMLLGGDLLPNEVYKYNIGSSSFPFSNVYTNNLTVFGLKNKATPNFLTYNISSGEFGYNPVGQSTQIIYNTNGSLSGAGTLTFQNNMVTAGVYSPVTTPYTPVFASSLKFSTGGDKIIPSDIDNPIGSANIVNYYETNTTYGIGGGDFANFILTYNSPSNIGNNIIQFNIIPAGTTNNSGSFSFYYNVYDIIGGRYYLSYGYTTGGNMPTIFVTINYYNSSGQITQLLSSQYSYTKFVKVNASGIIPRLQQIIRTKNYISLYDAETLLISIPTTNLGTQFSLGLNAGGSYQGSFFVNSFSVSKYDGFPLTTGLIMGGDITPHTGDIMNIGDINYPFATAYISNITGTGGMLNVTGNATFTGNIAATNFPTNSDKRIKDDVISLDSSSSLITLNKLNPVQFTYRTQFSDTTNIPGFISQEVEQILPGSTTMGTGFIANIKCFIPCKIEKEINEAKKYYSYSIDLSGLRLTYPINICIRANNTPIQISASYDINYFTYQDFIHEVYVYGTEVQDFMYLSYDHIYTLNVSATQELTKRLDAQAALIQALQDRITALEAK
jgi:hypothetical protein